MLEYLDSHFSMLVGIQMRLAPALAINTNFSSLFDKSDYLIRAIHTHKLQP
jgi:hypothetical protein